MRKCYLTVYGQKPPPEDYPTVLNTIGDHLRKVRMDRGLLQKVAAKQIGITASCLVNWELNHNQPHIQHWPDILKFLGYYPEEDDGSLGYMIRKYRRYEGVAQKVVANRIGVDEYTLWRIERKSGKQPSIQRIIKRIENFS